MRNFLCSLVSAVLLAAVGLTSSGGIASCEEPADLRLQGAGASFPFPIYSKWFKVYSDAHQNVEIDYQSVGSGAGVKNFIDNTVDFGASDMAMTPEEIARVKGGAQLLPLTAGNIVLTYNLPGVKESEIVPRGVCRHFPGQGEEVERPGHR